MISPTIINGVNFQSVEICFHVHCISSVPVCFQLCGCFSFYNVVMVELRELHLQLSIGLTLHDIRIILRNNGCISCTFVVCTNFEFNRSLCGADRNRLLWGGVNRHLTCCFLWRYGVTCKLTWRPIFKKSSEYIIDWLIDCS